MTEADSAGPYRLLDLLGQGGMGVVRRGVGADDREVAIKLMRPELAASPDFRRRLAREVDTMRRVHSPYVAEVLDADVDAARPYVVTRFIRGRPLDDEVRARGPLSGEPLRRVAAGLADALVAIHGAGVVHRDLKPNNVMLVDGSPVVIDFGIAHAVDATRLTRAGQVVGTPGYMGPEIIDGVAPGPAADVYGWAATVTFAAGGRSPFGAGSLESVLARIASGRPDLDGVPPGLVPCLRAALDRDPERRPSAARLARWVREIDLGATPPAVVPPTMPEAVGLPPGTRRVRPPLVVYKALAYLSIAGASALCAMLPVVACPGAVFAGWYLRAGDTAARGRDTPARTAGDLLVPPGRAKARSTLALVPILLYAGLVAAAVGTVLAVWGRLGGDIGSGTITKATAFVFAYVTLAGPRALAPRRQLVRLLSAAARSRRTTTGIGLVLGVLTLAAVFAVWATPPSWWPLPSPYGVIGRLAGLGRDLVHHAR
jgi:hypothetical protein